MSTVAGRVRDLVVAVGPLRRTVLRLRRANARSRQHLRRNLSRLKKQLRRLSHCGAYVNVFYRVRGEADRCPACRSRRIRLLEPLYLRKKIDGKRTGFITGCDTCGILFANPMPTASELEDFYGLQGGWAAGHQDDRDPDTFGVNRRKLSMIFEPIRAHLDVLSPPPGARVLDFGCGHGGFLNSLQQAGWDTYGIEPSTKAAFRRHHELAAPPAEPVFHLVVLNHVLEHLRRPLDVLRAVARSMRDGGYLFISVPRLETLPQHGDLDYCIRAQGHLVAYTEDSLAFLLRRAGLEVERLLDAPALDDLLTRGAPCHLRLLATKRAEVGTAPDGPTRQGRGPGGRSGKRPLEAALRALRCYRKIRSPRRYWIERLLPVRLRASWADARRRAVARHGRPPAPGAQRRSRGRPPSARRRRR